MASSQSHLRASESVLDTEIVSGTRWSLSVLSGDSECLQSVPIGDKPLRIGRHSKSDLVISHPSVSKAHAEILTVGPTIFIRDLDSTNGTFVNGRRLHSLEPLGHGDQIRIERVDIRVEGSEAVTNDTEQTGMGTKISLDHWLTENLDELVRDGGLHMVFQPIVHTGTQRPYGFEALLRTRLAGLESPADLFQLASRIKVAAQVSHTCRMMAATDSGALPRNSVIFLNSSRDEQLDDELLQSLQILRDAFPDLDVVLEIHEGCVTEEQGIRRFYEDVTQLGIRLAFDDFGTGNSRLQELLHVRPAFIKFDRSLIQGLDSAQGHQWLWVQSLVHSVRDLGIQTIAEGVESAAVLDSCQHLGFDLCQGFATGTPEPARHWQQKRDVLRDTRQEFSAYSG